MHDRGTVPEDLWAVIPVKPFAEGKSRLELPVSERCAVNRAFLKHVVETVGAVIPRSRIVIVSRDAEALALASLYGARGLAEAPGGDLNHALAQGAAYVQALGANAVLSISTDLPHLSPDDVRAMIAAFTAENAAVLAPDDQDVGTNAILMRPLAIQYHHGIGSLALHRAAAEAAGIAPLLVRRPGLARDVDTPFAYRALLRETAPDSLIRAASAMTSDASAIFRDRSGMAISARAI